MAIQESDVTVILSSEIPDTIVHAVDASEKKLLIGTVLHYQSVYSTLTILHFPWTNFDDMKAGENYRQSYDSALSSYRPIPETRRHNCRGSRVRASLMARLNSYIFQPTIRWFQS